MEFEGTIASVCDYLEISPVFNESVMQLLSLIKVTGIECDSRRVTKGTIFYARKGAHYNPFEHLEEIKAKGAVAILIDAPQNSIELNELKDEWQQRKRSGHAVVLDYVSNREYSEIEYHTTDDTPEAKAIAAVKMVRLVLPRHKSLGGLASFIYGNPSERLRVIGVTGTNGKSTITHLIAQMLEECGHKCAILGTLGHGFLGQLEHSDNTTLDAISLQRELKRYADEGADYAVMEVSSIGFCEGRVSGVTFYAGAFSNLSRDHLDYHVTMEDYFSSKLNFLRRIPSTRLVVNCQNESGKRIAEAIPNCYEVTIGKEQADYNLAHALNIKRINYKPDSLELFVSKGERSTMRAELKLLGEFNAENYAVALGVMLAIGYDYKFLLRIAPKLRPITGRMECFTRDEMPRLIVDYAHTPDGVEQALKAVRAHSADNSRVFVVLGCGGDRDRGKRAIMALKASVYADYAIFTADNPRSEPIDQIFNDMCQAIMPRSMEEVETIAKEDGSLNAEQHHKWQQAKARAQRYLEFCHTQLAPDPAPAAVAAEVEPADGAAAAPAKSAEAKLQAQKESLLSFLEQQSYAALVETELGATDAEHEIVRGDFKSSAEFEAKRRSLDHDLQRKAPTTGLYASAHPVLVGLPLGLPVLESPRRNVLVIADRYQAIRFAFEHAKKQDCILIAGKGHEDYQIFKNYTSHFSDREVCAELLGTKLPEEQDTYTPKVISISEDETPEAVVVAE